MKSLPIAAIVPTRNRAPSLRRTFDSLLRQESLPAEIIVIDSSEDSATKQLTEEVAPRFGDSRLLWLAAESTGAAAQRNQGCAAATQAFVWFFDDDVIFDAGCLDRLWRALQSDERIGGVNAMIKNQLYKPPGLPSRAVFALLGGRRQATYAGQVLGPAVNLLPEDRDELPEIVPVEWLNTTCTLYRREALPDPPFDSVFTGYSLMEDLALSLRVGRRWKLANARMARIFHDSQPGAHKSDVRALSCMELINRHYVMTRVMNRARIRDYLRLSLWELFQLAGALRAHGLRAPFRSVVSGKVQGLRQILAAPRERPIIDANDL